MPVMQDYGDSWQVKCKCGNKTAIVQNQDKVVEVWNDANPVAKPTQITMNGYDLIELLNDEARQFSIYSMEHVRNGIYRLQVRWH